MMKWRAAGTTAYATNGNVGGVKEDVDSEDSEHENASYEYEYAGHEDVGNI